MKTDFFPLSFSSLKAFSVSPLNFIHYKLHKPPPTSSMDFGTRVHMAILEPNRFERDVVVYDGRRDKRTEQYREFMRAHPGAEIVTPSELDKLHQCRDRVLQNPSAASMLEHCHERERKIEFTRKNVPHRGIVDAHGHNIALDVKTAAAWQPRRWERAAYDALYFMQAAMYVHGLAQNNVHVDRFFFLVIQSAAPFHVVLYEMDASYINRGFNVWDSLLAQFESWDGTATPYKNGDTVRMCGPEWIALNDDDDDAND